MRQVSRGIFRGTEETKKQYLQHIKVSPVPLCHWFMIRFIIDSPHNAAFNMAADQFLLEQCSLTDTIYIRFYSWQTPSITIGYMQRPDDLLDLKSLQKDNVCWIKRPTGGRAVLHFEDLTYSFIFPNTLDCLGSTVQQSYQIITECLITGLNLAGVTCQANDSYEEFRSLKRETKLPCFLAPNRDEIMVNGKKLVGSAQRRSISGVLQHGSIPLSDYYRSLPMYLNQSAEEKEKHQVLLSRKSICLWEINRNLNFIDLVRNLQDGFKEKLNMPFYQGDWTGEELQKIENLANSEQFKKQWLS